MDKSRLERILAAVGIVIALALAGWGLWTVTHPAKTPANQGTKESYQAMVDWYENAANLSTRCSGGA